MKRRGKVRRAKLYYLRERRGKSARIPERVDPRQAAAAKAAAEVKKSGGPLFAKPKGAPDDLTRIEGVDTELAAKLNSQGVTKFDQIANFSDNEVAKLDDALSLDGRIESEDWIGQSRTLVAETTVDEIVVDEPAADDAPAEAEKKD